MEEALDLRIHKRRRSGDEWVYSAQPHRQLLLDLSTKGEDRHENGNLVIVEAGSEINSPPLPAASFTPPESQGVESLDEDEAQRKTPNGRSGRYTSKHIPSPEKPIKPTRLMCFLCDQKAKNGKTLETHIQKSHGIETAEGRLLTCTECVFKSPGLNTLKNHFQETHANPRGEQKAKAFFPCSHCSRMYRKQSLLDAHMRLVNQKDTWKKNNLYLNT